MPDFIRKVFQSIILAKRESTVINRHYFDTYHPSQPCCRPTLHGKRIPWWILITPQKLFRIGSSCRPGTRSPQISNCSDIGRMRREQVRSVEVQQNPNDLPPTSWCQTPQSTPRRARTANDARLDWDLIRSELLQEDGGGNVTQSLLRGTARKNVFPE